MPLYRYRTCVLTGPWRNTREEALEDAIRSKQAREGGVDLPGFRWAVEGEIEESDDFGEGNKAAGGAG